MSDAQRKRIRRIAEERSMLTRAGITDPICEDRNVLDALANLQLELILRLSDADVPEGARARKYFWEAFELHQKLTIGMVFCLRDRRRPLRRFDEIFTLVRFGGATKRNKQLHVVDMMDTLVKCSEEELSGFHRLLEVAGQSTALALARALLLRGLGERAESVARLVEVQDRLAQAVAAWKPSSGGRGKKKPMKKWDALNTLLPRHGVL